MSTKCRAAIAAVVGAIVLAAVLAPLAVEAVRVEVGSDPGSVRTTVAGEASSGDTEPDQVLVSMLTEPGADLGGLVTRWRATAVQLGGIRSVAALVPADRLAKLAAQPGVLVVFPAERAVSPAVPGLSAAALAGAPRDGAEPELWYARQMLGADRALANGFDGAGVTVGIEDTGVDFGHPDLHGTFARDGDPDSPYHGFPLVYDDASAARYVLSGGDPSGTSYADSTASFTPTVGLGDEGLATISVPANRMVMAGGALRPMPTTVTRTIQYRNTSRSGRVHFGVHPDSTLERTEVTDGVTHTLGALFLVVDEAEAGVYDTVRVDLGTQGFDRVLAATYDFRDVAPVRLGPQADPTVVKDLDGDGLTDLSGGLVYFIADGAHHVPILDWLWDADGSDDPGNRIEAPAPGALVAFFGDFDGNMHGTAVASQIVGQGVIEGRIGVGTSIPAAAGASDGETVVGGVNPGLAPGAKLFATRELGVPNQWLAMTRGYDGVPGSGDDAQIINNSWGSDETSRLLAPYDVLATALNAPDHAERTLIVVSAGNGGQGYGTINRVASASTVLGVGGGTQFGTDDFIEIVSDTLQISYGDPSSFTSRGPDLFGRSGVAVMAVGSSSSGAWPVNRTRDMQGLFNGNHAWRWFGGTSQAAPQTSAVAALVFQAHRQRTGQFPTWSEARTLVQFGAEDADHDPAIQGAGLVNADHATAAAAGLYGAGISAAEWNVGDYRGEAHLAFPNLARRGASYTRTFTLTNPSDVQVTLDLASDRLTEIGQQDLAIETTMAGEDDYGYRRVDYLVTPDQLAIPPGTDLMAVRLAQDFGRFCPEDPAGPHTACGTRGVSAWYLRAYAWHDWNGNGRVWDDADGNGVVNDGELDLPATLSLRPTVDPRASLELSALSESYLTANVQEVRVRQPEERAGDGLLLGLVHRVRAESVPTDTLGLHVTYYQHRPWPWLDLDRESVTLAPGASEAFEATVVVPEDADYGFHQGAVRVTSRVGDDQRAGVRALHALPGTGPVDLLVDGQLVAEGVAFGTVAAAPYVGIEPGDHRVRVVPSGAASAPPLVDQHVRLRSGTEYTLAVVGTTTGAGLQPIVDGNLSPEPGTSVVRAVHLSPDAGSLDAYVDGMLVRAGIKYRDVTATLAVPDGEHSLALAPTGQLTPVLAVGPLALAGDRLTFYAVGQEADSTLDVLAVESPSRAHFPERTTHLAATVNVAASSDLATRLVLGGLPEAATPYDIGRVFGLFDWRGNGTSQQGDWRSFLVDVPDEASLPDGARFLAHTVWSDPPTDIDLLAWGPRDPDAGAPGGEGPPQADAALFGPYDLGLLARSEDTGHPADGAFGHAFSFRTATGGAEEWLSGPLSHGLHLFGHQNVLYGGASAAGVPFTTSLGVASVSPSRISVTTHAPSGTAEVAVSTALELSDVEALAFGLHPTEVHRDAVGAARRPGNLADPAGNRTYALELAKSGLLEISLEPDGDVPGYDLDLYLQRDTGDGAFAGVASSAGPTAVERVRLLRPEDGTYRVLVHGYTVPPGATYTLTVRNAQGDDLTVTRLSPGPGQAPFAARFEVSFDAGAPSGDTRHGILFIGPAGAPTVFEVPVQVTRMAGLHLPLLARDHDLADH